MGITGHPLVETPNLDMMAAHGVLFENAYSATPSCIPARASLLTGLCPENHGRVGYLDGMPWRYETTLPGEFAKKGYYTQCVGKMHVYPERNLCGFHNVILHDGYLHNSRNYNKNFSSQFENTDDYLYWIKEKLGVETDLVDSGLECNSWVSRPWIYEEKYHPTNWVVNESINFLRRKDPTKPFFLKMSFVRPHSPLDPPKYYFDMYMNQHEDIPESPIGEWADKEDLEGWGYDISCKQGVINKKALTRAKAGYYGSITHIDHQIGRFLQVLNEYGELNNSIILFLSDHGDMLGDHNFFRKALPYEGSVKVPMILYDPGDNLKIKKGQKIKEVVELRDVMPTLLDIAGIEPPETVDGKSMKGIVEGKKTKWREYIHGEHSLGQLSNHFVTDGKVKYIWYSQTGVEQFFDLEKDPKEIKNLIADSGYELQVKQFRSLLIKELDGREEGYSDGEKLIIGSKPKDCLNILLN